MTARLLNASEAAKRLGVSPKALRLYEERGLLKPARTAAGWRAYGADQMARATEIVQLRAFGLGLVEIGRVLDGDAATLARALVAHEAALEAKARQLVDTVENIRKLRAELDGGTLSVGSVVSRVYDAGPDGGMRVAIDLPWPWGGERFEIRGLRRLTHIVGPLGSGKTRLAKELVQAIPGASFVSLDRLADAAASTKALLLADEALAARVDGSIEAIIDLGGSSSDALLALLTALEIEGPTAHIVDMLEEGLDGATQEALMCFLRRRAPDARPLMFLTRSICILDVDLVGQGEAIIFCPANHSPPMHVAPHAGAAGYEALVTSLAPPAVRARTAGVIAIRSGAARA